MPTIERIAAKLKNDGFRVGMPDKKAIDILNNCVAPVACCRFFTQNKDEILKQLQDWETNK